MKTKTYIYILLVTCLFNTAQAQKKIIEIKTEFDLDVRYRPSRMEPVTFYVHYINQPEHSKFNYSITFKSKGDTKFSSKDTILLKVPIDIEAMREELNNKLQIESDTIRVISNNTIYDLADSLYTIPNPIIERTIAGNLILNSYIKVFNPKNDLIKDHKTRQDSIQNLVQPLLALNLKSTDLSERKIELELTIKTNNQKIRDLKYNIENITTVKEAIKATELANASAAKKNSADSTSLIAEIKSNYATLLTEDSKRNTFQNYSKILTSVLQKIQLIPDSDSINDQIVKNITELEDNITGKQDKITGKIKLIDHTKLPKDSLFKNQKIKIINILRNEVMRIDTNIQKSEKLIAQTKDIKEDFLEKTTALSVKSKLAGQLKIDTETLSMKQDTSLLNAEKRILELQTTGLGKDLENNIKALKALNDSILEKTNTLESEAIFQINKLSLQVERGFIERIQVYIPSKKSDQYNIYENIFAIGFSSIKNLKKFTKTMLYSRLTDDFIYLSDVIANYDNLLENYTRDYSPADTAINNFKPKQGFIRLNRDQFMNLFDTRVYTDLMGISNSKPNGLVQIEVARKFNIQTSRHQLKGLRYDWGAITYFNIFGSLNKLENNKKYLPLRNENLASNGQLISPFYATNLDFRLYQNLSLGAELNVFLFDWPDGKLTAFFDVGLGYGQTPLVYNTRTVIGNTVTQSIRDSSSLAHSSTVYPKITLEIFSEKRVRLYMSYQFNTTRIYSNNNFKAITSYAKSDLIDRATEPYARRSHLIEFNLMASPSSAQRGRFFFRARYFIQSRDHNTFFSQIQFGYTYNLRLKKFDA